jgi:hypothetical protein
VNVVISSRGMSIQLELLVAFRRLSSMKSFIERLGEDDESAHDSDPCGKFKS